MIEKISIKHHIQKHIIDVLMYTENARFRDLRPKGVDTNLFSYHLQALITQRMVRRLSEGGYTLSELGLSYVDRVSTATKTTRTQPKIITMLVIQNEEGEVLLQYRTKQPYINSWTLPYGKVHVDDETVLAGAQREMKEKLSGLKGVPTHAGECYIRVLSSDKTILSSTLVHVFKLEVTTLSTDDSLRWVRPEKISSLTSAPAVEEIVTRTFFNDPFFFEEYTVTHS